MLLRGLGGKWLGPAGFGLPLCSMGIVKLAGWAAFSGFTHRSIAHSANSTASPEGMCTEPLSLETAAADFFFLIFIRKVLGPIGLTFLFSFALVWGPHLVVFIGLAPGSAWGSNTHLPLAK